MPKHKQFLSATLFAVALSVFIASPLYSAKAVVPVLDSANLAVNTATAKGVEALVTKEYALDPLAFVAKLVVRTLRDMVIRWIITGRFEGPAF